MRVLILNSARKFIGEAAHCLDLARELQARGHEVRLGVRRGFELAERARAQGATVVKFNFNSGFHPFKDGADLRKLRGIFRDWRPEVVHCHRGKDHWLAAGALAWPGAQGARPAVVRTRHVVVPMATHALNRWLLRKRTDGLIAVSRAAAKSLPMEFRGPARVVLSAVDCERFSPTKRDEELRQRLGARPGVTLTGLVGRLQRIKGQEVFLRAAAKVSTNRMSARFVVAGRGSEERLAKLRSFSKELGISQLVHFVGWSESIESLIASLDVGVVASLGSEGSSRIAYECMASGVPLVATTVGALPEIVEDGKTGILVPPGDEVAMAAAIERLLESGELRKELAGAAREYVSERHNYDRWVAETIAVYDEAAETARTNSSA